MKMLHIFPMFAKFVRRGKNGFNIQEMCDITYSLNIVIFNKILYC